MFGSYEKPLLPLLSPVPAESRSHSLLAALSSSARRNLRPLLLASLILASFLLFLRPTSIPRTLRQHLADSSDIFNRTLGFERVIAISFPERTDKRDTLLLASSYVGFDLDWLPGVAFDSIDPKAAPVNWSYDKRSNGSLGCWRAHMNALHYIVQNRIHTALIVEDDSDFDINLKTQLAAFAEGTRALQSVSDARSTQRPLKRSQSPYGPTWDMLWTGHCKLGPHEDQRDFWAITDDPTVPPQARRHGLWMQDRVPPLVKESNTSRIVFRATYGGLCTYSYAVTYDGARKILAAMSVQPQDDAIDMSFRRLCRNQLGVSVECLGIYPTLFGSHRAAGPSNRDSDLNDKDSSWHREYSYDIAYSAMQNVLDLANGSSHVWSQYEESRPQLWNIRARPVLKGQLVHWDLAALGRSEIKGLNRGRSG